MNGEQRPGWYFAHAQDDIYLCILRMLEGTFSLDTIKIIHMEWLHYVVFDLKRPTTRTTYPVFWVNSKDHDQVSQIHKISRHLVGFTYLWSKIRGGIPADTQRWNNVIQHWFNVLTLNQCWTDVVSTLCACWDVSEQLLMLQFNLGNFISLYNSLGKFGRQQIDNIFPIFPKFWMSFAFTPSFIQILRTGHQRISEGNKQCFV